MSEPEVEERPRRRLKSPLNRERLAELAVVVFGVLIALGLGSLADEIRLRGDARELETAFQADIEQAVMQAWERQQIAPCLAQRLVSLADRTAAPGPVEAAPAMRFPGATLDFALPVPYRAPTRLWTTSAFDRALGTEAFKRIPRARADAYAVLFAQIAERREANAAEFLASAALAPLAYADGDLNAEVRADLLQQIAALDRHQTLALAVSGQLVRQAFEIPTTAPIRARIVRDQADLRAMVAKNRTDYGDCVDAASLDRLIEMAKAKPA